MVGLSCAEIQQVVGLVKTRLRGEMFKNGSWTLDYVRIRVRAEAE